MSSLWFLVASAIAKADIAFLVSIGAPWGYVSDVCDRWAGVIADLSPESVLDDRGGDLAMLGLVKVIMVTPLRGDLH